MPLADGATWIPIRKVRAEMATLYAPLASQRHSGAVLSGFALRVQGARSFAAQQIESNCCGRKEADKS